MWSSVFALLSAGAKARLSKEDVLRATPPPNLRPNTNPIECHAPFSSEEHAKQLHPPLGGL